MADAKISALPAAALPLAGTEVLPIVQSASTKKVAVDDLTVKNVRSNATTGILQVAGPGASTTRVMTVPNENFTAARIDAAQTFSGTQTFAGANIYNVINNTGAAGSNASPSFVGTQFLGNASRLIAQTDGGDCSNSSFRGVYRIRTCDDGSAAMNTRMQFDGNAACTLYTVNFSIDTAGKGILLPGGITWTSGAGSPENVVTAPVGSLYSRSDGGLVTSLYVKESGAGNTGWIGK